MEGPDYSTNEKPPPANDQLLNMISAKSESFSKKILEGQPVYCGDAPPGLENPRLQNTYSFSGIDGPDDRTNEKPPPATVQLLDTMQAKSESFSKKIVEGHPAYCGNAPPRLKNPRLQDT